MTTNSPPGLVFISYKREEAPTAAILRDALVKEGYAVWWDEDLQCGQAWAETLDAAVREAACIIVLWSKLGVASQWVRHEASQAIARDVYAPCRIELVQLESPYDRIQATDLISWDGDHAHGGFRNLLARVKTLVPAPVSLPRRIGHWLGAKLTVLVASAIATFAVLVLMWIVFQLRDDRLQKVYDCSASRGLRVELALAMYFEGKSLEGACLRRVDLTEKTLTQANLVESDLTQADLIYADLTESALTYATITYADLTQADLTRANLTKTDLTGAYLYETNLSEANLTGANLTEAELYEANLTETYLRGANLTRADLTKADLTDAVLTEANFKKACAIVPPTGWPEDLPSLPPCSNGKEEEAE